MIKKKKKEVGLGLGRQNSWQHVKDAKLYSYLPKVPHHHHYHHLSLNREGRWGTTDDFATSSLHFSLFSTALWDLANSRPVHSLMSSHLFLYLPCIFPLSLCLARWFWPDLMNGRQHYTTKSKVPEA